MRIRKNKKLSEMGYEGLHDAYECRLNQSPWDLISFSKQTFSSSLNLGCYQLQNSDNSDGNSSSIVCASASFMTSEDGKEMAVGVSDTFKQKEGGESETETTRNGKFRSINSDNKCVRCQKIGWSEGCDECCLKLSDNNKNRKPVSRSFLATKRLAREANKIAIFKL